MNTVKSTFSIKDLESFGGIKAHTIRMWERRYNLLEPERTPTNIRTYSLEDLQKLLNVTFLLDHNFKISKIAKNSSAEIASLVAEIVEEKDLGTNHHAINSFNIAMMNFDQRLFSQTYNQLRKTLDFRSIFFEVFIPLLEKIGLLWQAGVVNPAHEHFISNLIKQKILINLDACSETTSKETDKIFILFLPENEIHDLGLMFLNYELESRGYKCVYLGQNMHIENLKYIVNTQHNPHFISYLTVNPCDTSVKQFAEDFNKTIEEENIPLYLMGRIVQKVDQKELPANVQILKTIDALTATLN